MRKRLKVSSACQTCRSRKVKCNGARPVCDVCIKREETATTCVYDRGEYKIAVQEAQASSARSELAAAQMQPFGTLQQTPSDTPTPTPEPNKIMNGSANRPWELNKKPNQTVESSVGPSAESLAPGMDDSRFSSWNSPFSPPSYGKNLEGADSMTGIVGEPSESHQFFGNSSAGSFMRQMQYAVDIKLGVNDPNASSVTGPSVTQSSSSKRPSIEYVLPPRKTGDELVNGYWELVYPLYPFLDRTSFMVAYDSIWMGSDTAEDESILLCTVNVMFALGAQVSGIIKPEERGERAHVYFNRANSLIDTNLWEDGSVALVSCLLLMGIYLQSTNSPQKCWIVTGHAIRMAQSLGLHLPEYSASAGNQRTKEVARRIWHGCVLMDRVLAMTYGRPAMIPTWLSTRVPLPNMIDDEFLDTQSEECFTRPDDRPCLMEFYVSQLQLHEIMNNILLKLYMVHDGRQHPIDIITTFKLDEKLINWSDGLSNWLQFDIPLDDSDSLRHRLAILINISFFHARILLLRPILAQYCLLHAHNSTKLSKSLASIMTVQCSSVCLEIAHRSLEIIYTNIDLGNVFGPVPAWWYSVLYVYTAATVLLAERIQPEIGATIDRRYSNAVSWNRAIQILRAYARVGNSAKRCVAALEILSAKIPCAANFSESIPPEYMHQSSALPQSHESDMFGEIDLESVFLDISNMNWLQVVPESFHNGPT
ncbi:hypothetical protein N7456_009218 [Penicillium angulare]|uniref:Zn(2)-C6 fungal-type domain-containing protein n=1 Tax=Penicillium angulare TaxID=116970 RepID=A0A9W9F4G2_9EURO|nr:hypothetical protein N7456_009218 [Penicillium angulare]